MTPRRRRVAEAQKIQELQAQSEEAHNKIKANERQKLELERVLR
eukprot:COSAG01_NODE_5110_length_4475_cov_3.906764_5_plen_44_part_00